MSANGRAGLPPPLPSYAPGFHAPLPLLHSEQLANSQRLQAAVAQAEQLLPPPPPAKPLGGVSAGAMGGSFTLTGSITGAGCLPAAAEPPKLPLLDSYLESFSADDVSHFLSELEGDASS